MSNQNRSSVLQWLIPTGIMMVVVVVMLVSFYSKSNKEAENTVHKTLISSTKTYGERFESRLDGVSMAGEPIKRLLESEGVEDSARLTQLLGVAADSSEATTVFYSDDKGKAIDQNGASQDIGETAWFQEVLEGERSYIYVEETETIAVVKQLSGGTAKGYLLLFYPMNNFEDLLMDSGYDSTSFLAIIDLEGNVMGTSGASTNACLKGGNVFTALEPENKDAVRILRNRVGNGSRGNLVMQTGNQTHVVTFVPVGTNRWDMVLGVSKAYVDRQAGYLRRNTKNMVFSLLIVIGVFFCIVMVINIVGKIRSNEKKKELEDKADTDLLTGLNNKLATERKIKDYMAQNTNKQSMMFLFDIDNFKKINDTMGHAFGDEVLRSLGTQIGAIFRASDIVGRVGGDEFMVFLKDISSDEDILKEARKVENFFKSFQAGEYVKYKATASIGVAIFPQEGEDFETLYKAADQGLYKAKKRGKNQLAFYRDREPAGQTAAE
ncbi:MAG: diguanylate cyclase [Lachnospiraceae bacterium]|nr:diguanylate cyclase [Lachnospiraceae bacterium]